MTSYFKASLWLFAAVPGVPMRYLADEDGDTGKQRILDANEVEDLASTAGCHEHVEVCFVCQVPETVVRSIRELEHLLHIPCRVARCTRCHCCCMCFLFLFFSSLV